MQRINEGEPIGVPVYELPVTKYKFAINTVDDLVTEAQQLMVVVLDAETLEVEVTLESKGIGFVREGMSSEIKWSGDRLYSFENIYVFKGMLCIKKLFLSY